MIRKSVEKRNKRKSPLIIRNTVRSTTILIPSIGNIHRPNSTHLLKMTHLRRTKRIRNCHRKRSDFDGCYRRTESDSEDEFKETESQEKNRHKQKYRYDDQDAVKRSHDKFKRDKYSSQAPPKVDADKNQDRRSFDHRATAPRDEKRWGVTSKLSEEERAARLREMQEDAELHEEQRWKRLKKAEENDAWEATVSSTSVGRNFLDAAHRSVYGAEKGGSSTIEESVRRIAHYSQGRFESAGNAFRR